MKLTIRRLSEEGVSDNDDRDAMEIELEGVDALKFSDGEPEDATISRDFNDVLGIKALVLAANQAGLDGKKIEAVHEELVW